MAFTDETRNQPFLRVPSGTLWLIMALIVAHVGRVLAPPKLADEILINYAFIPARYSAEFLALHGVNPGSLPERVLPFVSYIFLHADFGHLAVNSLWLLAFGSIVARRFGTTLFILFFLCCGIAGAATHLAFNWGSVAPVIGASGAISGLMGAGFRIIGGSLRADGPPALAPLLSRRIVIWSAIWLGVNLVAGMAGLGAGTEVRLIAWQAHMGGYIAGLLLAGPFVAFHDRRAIAA